MRGAGRASGAPVAGGGQVGPPAATTTVVGGPGCQARPGGSSRTP